MTLARGESSLQAIVFATPGTVGLIMPGQRVRLLYDAYPSEQFGAHSGVVTHVSTAAIPAEDGEGPARYRIHIALEQQQILVSGLARPLQPDMTLKADIRLEERSLLEWMFRPLLEARARR